jgi:hypothetical protein
MDPGFVVCRDKVRISRVEESSGVIESSGNIYILDLSFYKSSHIGGQFYFFRSFYIQRFSTRMDLFSTIPEL